MIRDERKMVQVTGGQRPTLRIYTAAGSLMGSFLWEQERIAAMAWTLQEELMVLDQTGEVLLAWAHSLDDKPHSSLYTVRHA